MGRHHERHPDDYYKTPPACTDALLVRESFGIHIHEPACGDGAISRVLESRNHVVYSHDMIYRGYGAGGPSFDFLARKDPPVVWCDLVTNPPYALADEFVLHAHALRYGKIALLLRLAWLEGEKRRQTVFAKHPPIRVHVFSARQTLWKGDDPAARTTGGMAAYAWFVWEPGFRGDPTLHWIAK